MAHNLDESKELVLDMEPSAPSSEPHPLAVDSCRSSISRSNSRGKTLAVPERSPSRQDRRNSETTFLQIFEEMKKLQERLLIAHELAVGTSRSEKKSRTLSQNSSLSQGDFAGKRQPSQKVRILASIEPSDNQLDSQEATSPNNANQEASKPNSANEAAEGSATWPSPIGSAEADTSRSPEVEDFATSLTLSQKLAQKALRTNDSEFDTEGSSLSKSGPMFELRKEWGLNQGTLSRKVKRGLTSMQSMTPRNVDSEQSPSVQVTSRAEIMQDTSNTIEEDRRCIARPSSRWRLCWDVLAMTVLMFDLITLPTQVFYYEELSERILFSLHVLITLYWILDIPASLCTAVYVNNTLLYRRRDIAKRYVQSWFLFDILVLTPDIITLVGEFTDLYLSSGTTQQVGIIRAVRAGRLLRLLRMLRLLRLVKLVKVLNSLKAQVNNATLFLALGILKFTFLGLYMGHVLACLWFAVGDVEDGWVMELGLISEPAATQYLEAVQWALSRVPLSMMQQNMILKTGTERGLAITASFLAIGLGSVFISSITNLMADIHRRRERKKQLLQSVREYCSSHHISASHAMQIKSFVEREHSRKKTLQAHLELLETLPPDMLRELFHEARKQTLRSHHFFDEIGGKDRGMELDLCCKAANEQYMLYADKVFKTDTPSEAMYFISTGYCCYQFHSPDSTPYMAMGIRRPSVLPVPAMVRRVSSRLSSAYKIPEFTNLSPGCWVSEHAIWVLDWRHHGVLEASTDGWLLTLNAVDTHKCFQEHPGTLVDAVVHARMFLDKLNKIYELSYASDLPMDVEESRAGHGFLGWRDKPRLVHPADEAFANF